MRDYKKYCYNGECLNLFEWSLKTGIRVGTLRYRIIKKKLDLNIALFESPAKGVFLRRTRGNLDEMIDKRRTELVFEEREKDRKIVQINLYDLIKEERSQLNLKAVNEFFNPGVGEGSDLDPDDSDKRINALKRSFSLLYKPQPQNT